MIKPLRLIALMMSYAVLVPAFAQAPQLAVYTEEFPPYNFTENGQLKGINHDIVKAACELANIECTFRVMPWNRAFTQTLTTPESALFSTSRSAERENSFLWLGPLVSSNACFYKLKTRDDITVTNIGDLKRYTVGTSFNDIYQSVLETMGLEHNKHFLTYSHKHQDTRMFKAGKLDLIIGSSLTLSAQLAPVGLTPKDVAPVLEIDDEALRGNYLAVNIDSSKRTIKALGTALNLMRENGQYDEVVSRYVTTMNINDNLASETLPRCLNGAANYY